MEELIKSIINNLNVYDIIVFACIFITLTFAFIILYLHNANVLSFIFGAYIVLTGLTSVVIKATPAEYFLMLLAFILGIICMFALEIKRSVWILGNTKKVPPEISSEIRASAPIITRCINDIIKALQDMSKNNIGALIILANTKLPSNIMDSGVKLNADISSSLIESVFYPKTPLHDGAMIIQGTQVLAAGCFLPLSQEVDLPKDLGTRHRAGIGITEMIDVTAITVSEETGIISYAQSGKITRYADSEMLKKLLKEFYWQDIASLK